MFNLDQLNEERPEARQDQGWIKGCIPESPDSFIESLVQKVDHGRFRFELECSSHGPSLIDPSIGEAHLSVEQGPESTQPQQNMHPSPSFENQPNTNEVIMGELSLFELLNLRPGPPSIISSMLSSS